MSFLHKLQLQQGQKQKILSLLQLMALVVSVTAVAVGAALKKPSIARD